MAGPFTTTDLRTLRSALAAAASEEAGDVYAAACALQTAGYSLLCDRLGCDIAVLAASEMLDDYRMRGDEGC